jgi:1-deoxy-D-xylulose-5-phosphate reductoisomerase
MKSITILGSTGTIGASTLNILRQNAEKYKLFAISAQNNYKKLIEIALEFSPKYIAIEAEGNLSELKTALPYCEIISGKDSALKLCQIQTDIIVNGIVGFAGLKSTLCAIKHNQTIALANKESVVCGWKLIENLLKKHPKSKIIPVDSEHNALFQLFNENEIDQVEKFTITASGGPFFNTAMSELKNVTKNQALKHPNWQMGNKITIDSATLMNKGLELIEAHFLFNITPEKLGAIIHPQSIVHAVINYTDGNTKAAMANPNMQVAISFAISSGLNEKRLKNNLSLDLTKIGSLSFFEINNNKFPAINLAIDAMKIGKSAPCILNAANEVATELFLQEKIGFLNIIKISQKVLEKSNISNFNSLEELCEIDNMARTLAKQYAI